ncbi:CRP-like cAMP-binding protein [Neolewinella xylanilytica]|uniref:CRP-like cAMP-binding protein n=1 Tax=Neolewinella xylanilytica TaxID=1514080 RepID=A0A2S6I7Y9_9BACT|nr:response regulator [Neolewinella xylanilytica]PPK87616.1 CRP-like cAMP-binding protein [Neolewinella xylanilytica]
MDKTNILIIEDNEEVRENLAEILELYGYGVSTARHGLEGVKLALTEAPDLILCDVMMPELDGYGVLNLLSENDQTAGIPFVFITARTEKEDIRRGMNLGADDYITKPFYKDELLQVIRTRLKKAARGGTATAPAAAHLSDPGRGMDTLLAAFSDQGNRLTYDQGETIARDGEYPHFLYRIEEGHVHLTRTHEYGRDYIIADLGPGDLFGTACLLERIPLYYTARAATKTVRCARLPGPRLLELVNQDRHVAEALMHLLAGETVERSDRLVQQAYDSVRRRTALVLCDLHERYGETAIELSREELAQMVGTTKESVIRALSDFRRDGLIVTDGRQITVAEPARLRGLLV